MRRKFLLASLLLIFAAASQCQAQELSANSEGKISNSTVDGNGGGGGKS